MNTREEEYILALDKYRSITQAAENLHVTQPTLSIFLSKLENQVGMPLFERVGKRLLPTQAGQVYLKYARQICTVSKDFELEMAALKKEQQGQLYIGCLEKRSSFLMPRLFSRFQKTHPGIDVFLYNDHLKELFQALAEGSVDLLYVNQALPFPDLNARLVRRDHLLLALPKEHPAASRAKPAPGYPFPYLDLNHVAQETFYVPRKGYSVRFLVEDAIRYCAVRPQAVRPMATIELGCQMAAEGLGISFTTETYLGNPDDSLPLRYFLTGDVSRLVEWNIFWRKSAVLPQYMLDFMDMLMEAEHKPHPGAGISGKSPSPAPGQ